MSPIQGAVDTYTKGDFVAALSQFRRLANSGNAAAQVEVADMLELGKGTPKDTAASARYYRLAADQGDGLAIDALVRLFRSGIGVQVDDVAALKWEELGKTSKPSPKAQKDIADWASCIRHAADQGKPIAESYLAALYYEGRGVPKDIIEFERWTQRAADHGDGFSASQIGSWYQTGTFGRPKDASQALVWMRKAAEAGDLSANIFIGQMYAYGDGVEKNYAEAESYYLKAAKGPYAKSAKDVLGSLYLKIANGYSYGSDGLRKDSAEAAKWYQKSADSGDYRALRALARMYEAGNGVPKDYAEAESLNREYAQKLRAEAHLGTRPLSGLAFYELAQLLDYGPSDPRGARGVPQDRTEAVKLYFLAAEAGEKPAWGVVGGLCERGDGVPRDLIKAYFWYNLGAAAAGRDRVEKLLSPEEVAEAQHMSLKWQQDHGTGFSSLALPLTPSPDQTAGHVPSVGIRADIDQIAKGGHYSPLPVSSPCVPHSGVESLQTVENATPYPLRVEFSGPVDRDITVPPGQKQSVSLPSGAYRVAGSVRNANVLPFYGEETYKAKQECAVQFYLSK